MKKVTTEILRENIRIMKIQRRDTENNNLIKESERKDTD